MTYAEDMQWIRDERARLELLAQELMDSSNAIAERQEELRQRRNFLANLIAMYDDPPAKSKPQEGGPK